MTVSSDISAEQARQLEIHPVRPASHLHWHAVTTEEILESLQEVRKLQDELMIAALELGRRTQDVVESIDCRDREEAVAALRRELVQSAACIQSWIEWIDEGHRLPRLVTRHDTIGGHDVCRAVLEGEGRKNEPCGCWTEEGALEEIACGLPPMPRTACNRFVLLDDAGRSPLCRVCYHGKGCHVEAP